MGMISLHSIKVETHMATTSCGLHRNLRWRHSNLFPKHKMRSWNFQTSKIKKTWKCWYFRHSEKPYPLCLFFVRFVDMAPSALPKSVSNRSMPCHGLRPGRALFGDRRGLRTGRGSTRRGSSNDKLHEICPKKEEPCVLEQRCLGRGTWGVIFCMEGVVRGYVSCF